LIPLDNALEWYRTAIHARLALAAFTLQAENAAEAGAQTRSACDLAYKFRDTAGDNGSWLTERRDCWLMRTRLALAAGRDSEALTAAQRAVRISKAVVSGDRAADRFGRARALRLLGDAQSRSGNTAAAHDAWSNALAALLSETTETPREMDEHARVLESMGRSIEAAKIKSRLDAIGYHGVG
jgi:tetratricopeptide (TPR) repeat protein